MFREEYYIDKYGYKSKHQYVDQDGTPVRRNKEEYPYAYDAFVLWKTNDYDPNKGHWVYSDRMMQWDLKKYRRCNEQIGNRGDLLHGTTPEKASEFLSLYFNMPVRCTMLMEGCNVSSGYLYWVLCYIEQ